MSHAEDHEGTRRDFLYYATAGAGAVATGAAVWPLVNQMNASADVKALSSIRVDVSGVEVEKAGEASVFHTVQKGDTLSAIARTYLGNAMKYPDIFEANKPMLKDPDLIYPGQIFEIPGQ